MLFLLNKTIVDIGAPEHHLERNWKRLGCGEPASLSPEQAVQFAVMVVNDHILEGYEVREETIRDLASLIISKTGANAALFDGSNSARLNILPETVLENLRTALEAGRDKELDNCWIEAA